MERVTLFLAIWGAVVATAVMIWDVYKWNTAGRPQLLLTVSGPLISNDPRVTQHFLSISVTNIGQSPTTLRGLTFRYFETKPRRPGKDQPDERGFFNLFLLNPAPLPHKLDIGEVWTHFLELKPDTERKAREGFFYLEMEDSSTKKTHNFVRTRVVLSPKPAEDPDLPTLGVYF